MSTRTVSAPLADPEIRWAASAITAQAIIATPTGVTGSFTLHWGDGRSTDLTAGADPVPHTYTEPGDYKLTAVRDGATLAQGQVRIRPGIAPNVTFAPDASNPNIIIATIKDTPAELISRYHFTWGVGGPTETAVLANGATRSQGFPAGDHVITVRDEHTGRTLRETVTVVDKTYDPDWKAEAGSDALTVKFTLTAVGTKKPVLVDFGDYEPQHTWPEAEVGQFVEHTFPRADSYIVQVTYSDGSTEGRARLVTVPLPTAVDGKQR